MMEQRSDTARGRRVQLGDERLPAGIGRWDEVRRDDAIEVGLKVTALQGRALVCSARRLPHDLVEQVAGRPARPRKSAPGDLRAPPPPPPPPPRPPRRRSPAPPPAHAAPRPPGTLQYREPRGAA